VNGLVGLLAALHDAGVRFILVGGVAARAHGSARVTQDIDISYSRSDDNLERVVSALRPFDPYLRSAPRGLPFEWSVETLRGGLNFTLTTSAGDIELVGEIVGGGTYEDLEPYTISAPIFGHETKFAERCLRGVLRHRFSGSASTPRRQSSVRSASSRDCDRSAAVRGRSPRCCPTGCCPGAHCL
jgi:hypothetical protein